MLPLMFKLDHSLVILLPPSWLKFQLRFVVEWVTTRPPSFHTHTANYNTRAQAPSHISLFVQVQTFMAEPLHVKKKAKFTL